MLDTANKIKTEKTQEKALRDKKNAILNRRICRITFQITSKKRYENFFEIHGIKNPVKNVTNNSDYL